MRVVQGTPQHYDWGDERAIPSLLGRVPDGRPWAEFWWGTHPSAPSTVEGRPLTDVTGPLPFLVKVLAAARPLSLQLHPDADQAAAGFEREQSWGIEPRDTRRTYRDPWPKPELICALTPFDAVCGLAPAEQVIGRLDRLGTAARPLAERYRREGSRAVVAWLLRTRPDVSNLAEAAAAVDEGWAHWLGRVAAQYPGDPAVGVLPLLHHVTLEPGQALFLGAGHLHAYLHGVGLEVMGPSDNVVRCGLTTKHVDVEAVLALMRDDVLRDPVLAPQVVRHGDATVTRFEPSTAPFVVERWDLNGTADLVATSDELWWCHTGHVGVAAQGDCVLLQTGETVALRGRGEVFRVTASRPHPGPDRADAHGR